jgi:hypothetical protein
MRLPLHAVWAWDPGMQYALALTGRWLGGGVGRSAQPLPPPACMHVPHIMRLLAALRNAQENPVAYMLCSVCSLSQAER